MNPPDTTPPSSAPPALLKQSGNKGPHRFQKGESGNPSGRPTGSRNAASLFVEQLLEGEAEKLTRKLIERALEGNIDAMALVFARLAPARKDRPITFSMPQIDTIDDLAKAQGELLRQTSDGSLAPSEASTVANLLEARRRTIESQDHERRLAEIEAKLSQRDTIA